MAIWDGIRKGFGIWDGIKALFKPKPPKPTKP